MVNLHSDEKKQEKEIDNKTCEITDLFHHSEQILKSFDTQSKKQDLTAEELTVRNNMQRSIAKKLQGLSMTFRKTQKVRQHLYSNVIINW